MEGRDQGLREIHKYDSAALGAGAAQTGQETRHSVSAEIASYSACGNGRGVLTSMKRAETPFSMSITRSPAPPGPPPPAAAIRLAAEFLEMPGLRLTTHQTAKLIGVDIQTASNLLTTLVQRGFLRQTSSGYVRA